jgi:hypothetical protein
MSILIEEILEGLFAAPGTRPVPKLRRFALCPHDRFLCLFGEGLSLCPRDEVRQGVFYPLIRRAARTVYAERGIIVEMPSELR